jgi:hypothetical protein
MQLTRKQGITKHDLEIAGKLYEAVEQFTYLGVQINSKQLQTCHITICHG